MEQEKQLTIRSVIIGLCGMVIITASSMYVALKLGALPWPTVFVTITSFAVLNLFRKKPTLQEINVTHTLMSAGAMVAGGLAFTIPGYWMSGAQAEFPLVRLVVIAVCGAALGVIFTTLYRSDLIEKHNLAFPMGRAAYDTLKAGAGGGTAARILFSALVFSAVFTVFRDGLGLIPALATLIPATALTAALQFYVSPMVLGIGAMIGPLYSLVWLGGAVFGYYILVPLLSVSGLVADVAAAEHFRQGLGIGLMLGTGAGVALKILFTQARAIIRSGRSRQDGKRLLIPAAALAGIAVVLCVFGGMSVIQSLLLIAGCALCCYLSGTLTGQTGINPMEIFGILVFLLIGALTGASSIMMFSIAGVTAVACGLTGDVMNDLKSGSLLGTDHRAQLQAEAIGGIAGALVAVAVLLLLKTAFGFGADSPFPAPQAAAVMAMVEGGFDSVAVLIGLASGIVLFFLKAPTATLGLGIYLPVYLSSSMGLGACVLLAIRPMSKNTSKVDAAVGQISSGLLGGEAITGVVLALIGIIGAAR